MNDPIPTPDLTRETLLSFAAAALQFPSRPSVPTLYRWSSVGCRGVVLESVRVGGRWHTSMEALYRFVERCTQAAREGREGAEVGEGTSHPASPVTPRPVLTRKDREAHDARTRDDLRRLGMKV